MRPWSMPMPGVEGGGKLDAAAVELLVLATSAWLEVASLRKQALKEEKDESAEPAAEKAKARPPPCRQLRLFRTRSRRMRRSTSQLFAEPVPAPPVVVEQPVAVAEAEPVVTAAAAAAAPRPRQLMPLPTSRPRTPTSIARRSVSPGCWWMKSSCTTR